MLKQLKLHLEKMGNGGGEMKEKPKEVGKYLKEQTPMHKFAETSEISSRCLSLLPIIFSMSRLSHPD
jgi:hypothetical protein